MLSYPNSYIYRIAIIDSINVLLGLTLIASPFLMGFYPGSIITTTHVALGVLLAVFSLFRVLVAYRAAWVEMLNLTLAIIIGICPWLFHLETIHHYRNLMLSIAGIVLVASLLSALFTAAQSHHPQP